MPDELMGVNSGEQGVYRIAWQSSPVFMPPPWDFSDPVDGTFGNRFDDPGLEHGIATDQRFRVVYCATNKIGAFMESCARFRRPVDALAQLSSDVSDVTDSTDVTDAMQDLHDPEQPHGGLLPADWRMEHQFGHAFLDSSLRFVDLGAAATLNHLRHALADVVLELGLDDIDLSAVTGPHRKLTQRIARYVYEQADGAGTPRFAGIRYLSHHGDNQECWAVFHTRVTFRATIVELNILPDDPDLMAVASLFGLTIEVLDGQYLRP